MRVVVTVAFLLVLIAPVEASKSCMTKAEARKNFGAVHIYWHGTQHCWDATPKRRHRKVHDVRRTRFAQAQNRFDEPVFHETPPPLMIPAEEPLRMAWADRWVDVGPQKLSTVERWLAPPPVVERKPAPTVADRGGMGVTAMLLLMILTAALVGGLIYYRSASRRGARPAMPVRLGPPRPW